MRSGIHTTEFWLTLAKAIVGPILAILVATGMLSSEAESEYLRFTDAIVQGAVAIAALIMSGLSVGNYTKQRTKVKTEGKENVAN